MKKIFYLATAAIVCSGLLFTSCKKKENEDNDTDGAADQSMAETYDNDINNIGNQVSYKSAVPNANLLYTSCATVKWDTLINTDADTMTVDFGSTGCTGKDGRVRVGVIQFTYLAGMHYRDSGNVITVATPGNTYHVDHNQVIVNSKSITNNGHTVAGNLNWTVATDMKVNRNNGNSVAWSANKTKVLLAGERPNGLPIDWPNAKVAIYGTASGTHTKVGGTAESFSVYISQAKWVVRDFTCSAVRKHFVAGELEFTPSGKPKRVVNFGTGNCDNLATVTINGHTYNIQLR